MCRWARGMSMVFCVVLIRVLVPDGLRGTGAGRVRRVFLSSFMSRCGWGRRHLGWGWLLVARFSKGGRVQVGHGLHQSVTPLMYDEVEL